jgi:hypothetical protein
MAKVLHASGSGYFPFCLTKGTPPETGLGTNYPISLPLTKYMSWWWKVKTWRLTGSSACIETATPPEGSPLVNNWTTTSLVQDDSYTSSIPTAQTLVCVLVRVIKRASESDQEGVGFNGFSTGTFSQAFTNLWIITFENHGYISGSTIYPKMNVSGWYDSLSPGDTKVQEQLDPLSSFRIDGVTIPCYIKWFPNWTQYSNWSITGSQSFDLNPDEYWDYS